MVSTYSQPSNVDETVRHNAVPVKLNEIYQFLESYFSTTPSERVTTALWEVMIQYILNGYSFNNKGTMSGIIQQVCFDMEVNLDEFYEEITGKPYESPSQISILENLLEGFFKPIK